MPLYGGIDLHANNSREALLLLVLHILIPHCDYFCLVCMSLKSNASH